MQLVPDRAEMRALIRLAIPIVTVQVGQMMLGVVDTIMVGHISANALAAVAFGNLFFFAVTVLGMGILFALDPIISQAVGSHNEIGIARGVQRGFIIGFVVSVLMCLVLPLSEPVLSVLHQPAAVVPVAGTYIMAVMPSTFPMMGFVVVRQTLQALGKVRPVVITIIAANLLNLFLNYVFIFGHFGSPALGVLGSALATTVSRYAMFAVLVVISWPSIAAYLQPRRDSLAIAPIMRMVKLGLPIGVGQFFEFANFGGIALLMGLLGTNEVAAHQVAINIASLTFMVPAGIASAAAVLVGNSIGRGDSGEARRFAHAALVAGAAFMAFSALMMRAVPHALASVYTTDDAVLAIAVILLPIAGIFQVFDGLQVVGAGVLRGAGDTRVPMLVALAGFWLVGMPISVYFGLYTNAGAAGLWWGFVAGLAAVAIALLLRIRARFAGEIERVIVDEHHLQELESLV